MHVLKSGIRQRADGRCIYHMRVWQRQRHGPRFQSIVIVYILVSYHRNLLSDISSRLDHSRGALPGFF